MRTQNVLREAHVAARPLLEAELTAILRAMLTITDLGMLITDLEHRSLACNSKFGEMFQVESEAVPRMGVEELRGYVYPRLADREGWRSHLDETYSDPGQRLQDDLVLLNPFQVLHRTTGPVRSPEGEIIGRIWTFEDVTSRAIRQRRRDAIVEASMFHDPDPAKVCRYVVDLVAEEYGSTAFLSIRDGDRMVFREVAKAPPGFEDVRGNQLNESYCRVALEAMRPVIVQDASRFDEFREILPATLGFRRCLTVPISNMSGHPIGTLCFMDGRTEEALTEDDVEFISILANRLSTELERERLYEERSAAQQVAFARQGMELGLMESVLEAMNDAFKLVGTDLSEDELWLRQTEILRGVMGYSSVALVGLGEDSIRGAVSVGPSLFDGNSDSSLRGLRDRPEGAWAACEMREVGLGSVLGDSKGVLVRLSVIGEPVVLVLTREEVSPLTERHLSTLLSALAEQVALLLNSHRLRTGLEVASEELVRAEDRLIQAEKLGVAGTLAASVAHDIRNIMASMSLVCDQNSVSDSEKLKQVQTQIDRFGVLSHRLLSYVQPKSLSRSLNDIHELVVQAVDLLTPQAKISGVSVVCEFGPLGALLMDPHRVEHLIVNLMLNALQSMWSSGGVLRISTESDATGGRISIEDNGHGIPAHLLGKVFEPFVSSRSDGLGLGLYSCKQIASEHGWEIVVTSEPGKGTLFVIHVPIGG